MPKLLRTLPFGLVLLLAGLSNADAQTLLRWKLRPDETLRYAISQDMVTSFEANNQPMRLIVNQSIDTRWHVEAVDAEGTATVKQAITRVRAKITQNGQSLGEYDSASKDEPQGVAKMLAGLLGVLVDRDMDVKLNVQGEVVEFKFPPDVLEKLKLIPGGDSVGNLLSEQGMKQMLDILAMPAEAVTPGHSWQRHAELTPAGIGKEEIDSQFTYAGNETRAGRALDKIDMKVAIKFIPGENQQTKAELKEQDSKGVIYFDNAQGRLVETVGSSKLLIEANVAGNKLSQTMQIESRMSLVPEKQ